MKKTVASIILTGIFISAFVTAGPARGMDIQELIDRAAPGEVVGVPAGTYRGNFRLKEGVILEGSGSDETVLDGCLSGPVIDCLGGGVVKGVRIVNGLIGVKAEAGVTGVFDCVFSGNIGAAVRCGGGGCVLINNAVTGAVGFDLARAYGLIVNNTITAGEIGLKYWRCARSTVVNNIVAGANDAVWGENDSAAGIYSNIFWNNRRLFSGVEVTGDNEYLDPLCSRDGLGVYRLGDNSPALDLGTPIAGLPEELTTAVGTLLPREFPLEGYLATMEAVKGLAAAGDPLVTYTLLSDSGYFGVDTRFDRPDFIIVSSSESTPVTEIAAYDSLEEEVLRERYVPDDPPQIEVAGWEGVEYEPEPDRYVMESVFYRPESYYFDREGNLRFLRETTFARIRVIPPEGYRIESFSPEGEVSPEDGSLSILNPTQSRIAINLLLVPGQ